MTGNVIWKPYNSRISSCTVDYLLNARGVTFWVVICTTINWAFIITKFPIFKKSLNFFFQWSSKNAKQSFNCFQRIILVKLWTHSRWRFNWFAICGFEWRSVRWKPPWISRTSGIQTGQKFVSCKTGLQKCSQSSQEKRQFGIHSQGGTSQKVGFRVSQDLRAFFLPTSQCLKITQNVSLELFEFWLFSPIFDLLKMTCLVTLYS